MRIVATVILIFLLGAGCGRAGQPGSCGAAPEGWATPETGTAMHAAIVTHITLTPDRIGWNGATISEQTLVRYLRQTRDGAPVPFLILDPRAADCARLRRIRELLDRNYPCRSGACGQGSRSAFLPA